MSAEYGPVERQIVNDHIRNWRSQNYDPTAVIISDILEKTVECVDSIMAGASQGCSIVCTDGYQRHTYDRRFIVPLDFGGRGAFSTRLFITRTNFGEASRSVVEQYALDVDHFNRERYKLFGSSYVITQFTGRWLAAEIQHSLDAETGAATFGEGMWRETTAYELGNLMKDLYVMHDLQDRYAV